ncbi:IS701 family transposase [Streptomyces luteogriseus]|uniref:IS701 family transposase n=1 Tax=Streptomyces luteogriseus TaxID=68233 RepID=UPI0038177A83
MRVDELSACRARLEEFAGEVFTPLARADQRVKGGLYLRGLLLDGRRKSMQPMAGRLGVDHQQLQQFMTTSTWQVEAVRARLARRAVAVVRPQVWVVDDTGFPKDGVSSPAVARQYSGTLGKVGNCQIGVSVHAASDTASCPLSWRLFVPRSWDGPDAAGRRARCQIPDGECHRPKWQLALEMLDELAALRLRPAVLVADAGYGAKAAMASRFVFLRVRLAGRRPKPAADGVIGLVHLIAQWPEDEAEPVKYWISNLPADIPARDLVRLAKSRWRIEHDYRELKTTLGLDHFEGRSFTGWHRHVTLVSAAHLFLTEQRTCPKAPARA